MLHKENDFIVTPRHISDITLRTYWFSSSKQKPSIKILNIKILNIKKLYSVLLYFYWHTKNKKENVFTFLKQIMAYLIIHRKLRRFKQSKLKD